MKVDAINRVMALASLSNGEVIPVTTWFGPDGEESGADEATAAVAGPSADGAWFAIKLVEYEQVTVH